jgi:ABC-2 type transport system permease protein
MRAALRTEWIKLITVRMNAVLFVVAVAVPLVICSLTAIFVGSEQSTDEMLGVVTGTAVVTGMLMGVIGASSITGEFGFNTIRPTFVATPRRLTVMVAKAIITAASAVAAQLLVLAAAWGAMRVIFSARGMSVRGFRPYTTFDFDGRSYEVTFTWWHPTVGVVVFAAIVALLGYAIGLIIHNTPAAVAVLILWPLILESLVAGILAAAGVDEPTRFLPYTSGFRLAEATDSDDHRRWLGGLFFAVVAGALLAAGVARTNRSDA